MLLSKSRINEKGQTVAQALIPLRKEDFWQSRESENKRKGFIRLSLCCVTKFSE